MRIVSLLASGTEIVCALGLEGDLVGISHECDFPPEVLSRPRLSRPRFDPAGLSSAEIDAAVRRTMAEQGEVFEVDLDALAGLAPDLILTQALCEVCAVPALPVLAAVRRRGLVAQVLSLDAHSIREILDSIAAVALAAGAVDRGKALRRALERRLAAVSRAVAGGADSNGIGGPRVLALEWLDPPFLPGHWLPEMIAAAGGVPATGAAGERSREATWEELADLDPDVLLLAPCGYGLEASAADAAHHAARLTAVAPRAIAAGNAFVADGSAYFNRSGPRVIDGVEILAGLLHPGRVPPPAVQAARAWTPPAG